MHKKTNKFLNLLIFSLLLVLSSVPSVFASSPSSPAHPKYPYIVWDVSIRKTVVVHMLNATPYNMDLQSSTFANAVLSSSASAQNYANSSPPIAFTPSGIPTKVPAKTGASFVVSWLDTGDDAKNVLSTASMNYLIDNVNSSTMYTTDGCTINPQQGNVKLLLNFDRVKETRNLKSDVYKLILHTTAALVDGLEIALEPANPLAWAGFFTASQEAYEDIQTINEENASSDQIFFSAFIPAYNDDMTRLPSICSTYKSDEGASDYDGIATQQASSNGCPQSSLVVGVAVLREKAADAKTLNGNLPALFVVVTTAPDWTAAVSASTSVTLQASKAGNQISQQLQREGKNGGKALFSLVRTMSATDLRTMQSAYNSIHAHKALSANQESVLARLAAAFQKHADTVQPISTFNKPKNTLHRSRLQQDPVANP